MITQFLSKLIILIAGVLYPAYRSFKAVKTRNPREYVKWMMYWISFAFYTVAETIADLLIGWWFPLYQEAKILFFLWLLLPATNGTSILYRKFIHPNLMAHEEEIDELIKQYKDKIYSSILDVSRNGVTMAARTLVQSILNNGQNIVAPRNVQQLPPPSTNVDNNAPANVTSSNQDKQVGQPEIKQEIVTRDNVDHVVREVYQTQDNVDHVVREVYQTQGYDASKRLESDNGQSSQLDGEQRALLQDAFRNVDNRGYDDSDASLEISSQDISTSRSQLDLSYNLQSDVSSNTSVGSQYGIVTRSQSRQRQLVTATADEGRLKRQDINTISEYMPQFDEEFSSKLQDYLKY